MKNIKNKSLYRLLIQNVLIGTSHLFKLPFPYSSSPHHFFFSLHSDLLEMKTSILVWFYVCTSGIFQSDENKYVNISCLTVAS